MRTQTPAREPNKGNRLEVDVMALSLFCHKGPPACLTRHNIASGVDFPGFILLLPREGERSRPISASSATQVGVFAPPLPPLAPHGVVYWTSQGEQS